MHLRSLLLLLLLALPFFVALDDSSLWDANEAFYVETPRQMLERGDWIVPYFNGKPRLNKPPLAYWTVAVFYHLFGVSVFWERFAMAVLAYGSVLAVFRIGSILFEEQTALWGAGIFATTFRFLVLARRLVIDVLLLFCLLVAVAFFLSWLKREQRLHFIFCALFFGLAFLAKGPVALLPVAFLGLYLGFARRLRDLARAPWVVGSAVFLLVASLWFLLLAQRQGWEAVGLFFLQENLARYTHLPMGPQRGALYYPGVFLVDFLPWSVLFLAAVFWGIRRCRAKDENLILLACWVATYLAFFSFSQNKQEHYILPLYPAASLWLASYLSARRLGRTVAAALILIILFLGGLIYLAVESLFSIKALYLVPLLPLTGLIYFAIGGRPAGMVASLAVFYATAFTVYLEPLEAYKPVYRFAETIRRHGQGDFQAGYYRLACPSLVFYLQRPILELERLEEARSWLESDRPVFLVLEEADYPELQRAARKPLQIVEVRLKLYTTARTFIEGLRGGRTDPRRGLRETWTRPVYLVSNR